MQYSMFSQIVALVRAKNRLRNTENVYCCITDEKNVS